MDNSTYKEYYEKFYNLFEKYLSIMDISLREFARFAGIKPTTLQTAIYRNSKIRLDTFFTIVYVMRILIDDNYLESTKEALQEPINILNEILNLGHKMFPEGANRLVLKLVEDEFSRVDDIHSGGRVYYIESLLELLNVKGQQVAEERIKELTEIPKYQKNPPERQDEN